MQITTPISLILLINLAGSLLLCLPVQAETLQGKVQTYGTSDDVQKSQTLQGTQVTSLFQGLEQDSLNRVTITPQTPNQLESQPPMEDSDKTVDHPYWIPLHAYTNKNMLGEYGLTLTISGIPIPGIGIGIPISSWGQQVYMLSSISKYWHTGNYGSCNIWCNPILGHPGNFTFHTMDDPSGPRGWLQDTKRYRRGRRLYRYWFDQ